MLCLFFALVRELVCSDQCFWFARVRFVGGFCVLLRVAFPLLLFLFLSLLSAWQTSRLFFFPNITINIGVSRLRTLVRMVDASVATTLCSSNYMRAIARPFRELTRCLPQPMSPSTAGRQEASVYQKPSDDVVATLRSMVSLVVAYQTAHQPRKGF